DRIRHRSPLQTPATTKQRNRLSLQKSFRRQLHRTRLTANPHSISIASASPQRLSRCCGLASVLFFFAGSPLAHGNFIAFVVAHDLPSSKPSSHVAKSLAGYTSRRRKCCIAPISRVPVWLVCVDLL